jgi:hypothetical protein
MGYVIAVIVVLLLIAAFVTFMVLNATKKSGPAGPDDPGGEGSPAGIVAPDESPLGDTSEHAGDQQGGATHVSEGEAVDGPPGDRPQGGSGGVPVGGEAEGGAQDTRPDSERLADRPR